MGVSESPLRGKQHLVPHFLVSGVQLVLDLFREKKLKYWKTMAIVAERAVDQIVPATQNRKDINAEVKSENSECLHQQDFLLFCQYQQTYYEQWKKNNLQFKTEPNEEALDLSTNSRLSFPDSPSPPTSPTTSCSSYISIPESSIKAFT